MNLLFAVGLIGLSLIILASAILGNVGGHIEPIRGMRLASGILGVLLLGAGFGAYPLSPSPTPQVRFSLFDHLGRGQASERVTITISGAGLPSEKTITLTIDAGHLRDEVNVSVLQPGTYTYKITASTIFSKGPTVYPGQGEGTIDVVAGRTFEAHANYAVSPTKFWLVQNP
jgi:hypothetical protein